MASIASYFTEILAPAAGTEAYQRDVAGESGESGESVRPTTCFVAIEGCEPLANDGELHAQTSASSPVFATQKPTATALESEALCRLSPHSPHSPAWNAHEIETFVRRRSRLMRFGVELTQADLLAETLQLRDRDHDARRMCLECRHVSDQLCPDGMPMPQGLLHHCTSYDEGGA